jgi:hypothetical protein
MPPRLGTQANGAPLRISNRGKAGQSGLGRDKRAHPLAEGPTLRRIIQKIAAFLVEMSRRGRPAVQAVVKPIRGAFALVAPLGHADAMRP